MALEILLKNNIDFSILCDRSNLKYYNNIYRKKQFSLLDIEILKYIGSWDDWKQKEYCKYYFNELPSKWLKKMNHLQYSFDKESVDDEHINHYRSTHSIRNLSVACGMNV